MSALIRSTLAAAAMLVTTSPALAVSPADEKLDDIVVGVLSYGTAQWEMKVIQDNDLDEKHGINLVLRDLGSEQAGDVALQSGDIDIVLTDFIWVSIQRNNDDMVTSVPHSRAVGGVMIPAESDIASIEDLTGKTIGIAGGPVDKSWIILQAYYARSHKTGLAKQVDARFAQPPLVNQLLAQGDLDAALNYWHYNARAKAAGLQELISVSDMLAGMDIPEDAPLLVWAFKNETASEKPDAVKGFLEASYEAKRMLLDDDSVWNGLRSLMDAEDDDTLFTTLRADYRNGIVTKYSALEARRVAKQTFALMAEYGGADLVGDTPELAEGTFWPGFQAE